MAMDLFFGLLFFVEEIRYKDGVMALQSQFFYSVDVNPVKSKLLKLLLTSRGNFQKYGYWKDNLKDYALEGIEGQKKIAPNGFFSKKFFCKILISPKP